MKRQDRTKPSDAIVFLKGKQVILRPLSERDIPNLQKWINDPEIRRYLLRFTPISEAAERKWLGGLGESDRSITLGISYKGGLIGTIGLHGIDWKDRVAEVGISIGEKGFQERGLGTDAATTLIAYGFDTLNMHRLVWKAKSFNERSIKCALRCGFIEEARLREQMFVDGAYHDEVILGMLRREWVVAGGKKHLPDK